MMLAVENIRVGYDRGRLVLENVGFTLDRGRILAILGPNGAGKTTLLRCINALIRPWQGVVRIEDLDVMRMSTDAVARRLGYVAQRQQAGRLTVFDAVLLGRKPHMRWSPDKQDLSKVAGALEQLGLEPLALRHLDELSGGELQKVSIARALVQEPAVLLLDEPTSSLDLRNRIEILRIIRHIVREHRMAAVMTLHDINLGFRFADHLLFLKEGRVFAETSPEKVTADMVKAVYGVDVDILQHDGQRVVIPRLSETDRKHKE
jgi:iron complex transport system ATP-binding protein